MELKTNFILKAKGDKMRNSIIVYVDKSNQSNYTVLLLGNNAVYEVNYNEFNDVVTVCGFVCFLGDLDWKKLQEC